MKKHTSLSRSLNQSEGFELMENYYLSGLRPIEYYHRHGISKPQFYYWRRRYSDAHPQETPAARSKKIFHPLKIEYTPDIRISGLEIRYPNGVRVVISNDQGIEIGKLSELIKLRV